MAVRRDEAGKHGKKNLETKEEYVSPFEKEQWATHKKKQCAILESRPDCPHTLTSVAYKLMKVPFKFGDIKLIRETIEKAIKLAPKNPMNHHVMGQYHEKYGLEVNLALDAYTEAVELGHFGAHMALIRMHYRLNNQFNVIEALKEALDIYKDPRNQEEMYAQCGSFYLFIKKDLIESLKCYTKAGGENMDSYALKSHKPMFIRVQEPVNMLEVILEEMSNNTNWSDFETEDRKILTRFRFCLIKTDMETQGKKDRLSVLKILQMSRVRMDIDDHFKAIITAQQAEKNKNKKPFKWLPKKKDPIQENKSSSPKESHIHLKNLSIHSSEDDVSRDINIGTRKMSLMSISSDELNVEMN